MNRGRDAISELRSHAFSLADGTGLCVPEPYVKELLVSLGVSVPAGQIIDEGVLPSTAAAALREPFVVKAWGPGIVHKSELGAVRVGVSRTSLDHEAKDMLDTVEAHGVLGARLYVEEMAAPGAELLFGMVARRPFGVLTTLGLGGTLAELYADVSFRLSPLSEHAAREMIEAFKGSALLDGFRGEPLADKDALVSSLLALAGAGGLIDVLGDELIEFECNPLFVGEAGATAVDARLILREQGDEGELPSTPASRAFDPTALFSPRSIAVVGASATKVGWGNRTLERYRRAGWSDNLYAVHPTAESIDGVATFRTLAEIPGGVDFAEISVSAETAPSALRSARGNVRTAAINSAGFSETGEEGRTLELELLESAREGEVRFVGPNCMGVYSPLGRQVFSGAELLESGSVGAILQSGGLSTDLVQVGSLSGLRFSSVVSCGNAADVGLGELARYLLDDVETKVIAIHVEGGADPELVRVIEDARGVKPVVLFLPGLSAVGAHVAASHTGAMTNDRHGWMALEQATGASLAYTFERLMATLCYLDGYVHADADDDDGVLIIGLGGGASVLAADACDEAGIHVPVLSHELQARLVDKKGAIVMNPLDLRLGPAGPPAWASEVIDIVAAVRPFSDVMIHVDAMGYVNSTLPGRLPGLSHFRAMMESVSQGRPEGTRVAVVTRNLERAPGAIGDEMRRTLSDVGIPAFGRFEDAAAAVAAAKRFTSHRRQVQVEEHDRFVRH